MDDQRRVCLIETATSATTPITSQRFRLDDPVGSAGVEVHEDGGVISYEEYHPYGSTAFRAQRSGEVSGKRYRFTGMEKDEETGLSYHHHRYLAVWLGRWCSSDPIGLGGGINRWAYCSGSPMSRSDRVGQAEAPTTDPEPTPEEQVRSFIRAMARAKRKERVEALNGEAEFIWIPPKTAEDRAWEEAVAGLAEDKGGPYIVAAEPSLNHFDVPPPLDDIQKGFIHHGLVTSGLMPGILLARGGGNLDDRIDSATVGMVLDAALAAGAARSGRGGKSSGGVDLAPSVRGRVFDPIPRPKVTEPGIRDYPVPLGLRGPAPRHRLAGVSQRSVAKEVNTVIEPGVDIAGDVAAINRGEAVSERGAYTINGRTYGVHNGTLYPISGEGLHQLNRGAYAALGVLNQFGDTAKAHDILARMQNVGPAEVDAATRAWRAGQ